MATTQQAAVGRGLTRTKQGDNFRHVNNPRKYRFLIESTTSTSNDTTANNDEDTIATSFTTVTSDNDNSEDVVFASPAHVMVEPEPIFAVPSVCLAGGVVRRGPGLGSNENPPGLGHRFTGVCSSVRWSSACSSISGSGSGSGTAHAPLGTTSVRLFGSKPFVRLDRTASCHTATCVKGQQQQQQSQLIASDKSTCSSETSPSSAASSASPTVTATTTTTSATTASTSDTIPISGGISPILLLWCLLTLLVAGTCTFAFLQPFWVMHVDLVHTFGMVSYCFMDAQAERSREVCSAYGGYHHLANIPSGAWQAGCVLYGAGCVLMCVSSFLALSNLRLTDKHVQRVSLVAGYMQAVAGRWRCFSLS